MSVEESKAVVRRWFEAFNARDLAAEAAARAPDFVANVAGLPAPLDGAGANEARGRAPGGEAAL